MAGIELNPRERSAGLKAYKPNFDNVAAKFGQEVNKLRYGGYTYSLMPGGKCPTGPEQTAYQG